MQVQRDVRPVHLVAPIVGTGKILLDFYGQPAILLTVLQLVELEVLVLQELPRRRGTSRRSTSPCSCAVLSETSFMSEKLSSFLR